MKILAVNIAFRTEDFYKRWRLLTNTFSDTSVTLVGPKDYTYKAFGKPIVFKPTEIIEDKFKVFHINMKPKRILRFDWWDWELGRIIINEKPDIIYLIGYESRNALFMAKLASLFLNQKPLIGLFSMRGKDIPFDNKEFMLRWNFGRKWYSFIHVHYPQGVEVYRKQVKFKKTICMQTQIGVDKDKYFPNTESRNEIRQKYAINENDFVFGSAIRIQECKGVFDILDACEKSDFEFKFLLLGDGVDAPQVSKRIKESEILKRRIIWPGRIDGAKNVAAHLNAMDAFVHIPHTTKKWVDTFPLAVVQAMAIKLPVIGSDSGAVPYQLGPGGLLIKEGNRDDLVKIMEKLFSNRKLALTYGENLYTRVLKTFEIRHLNNCLYQNFSAYINNDTTRIIEDQADNQNLNGNE
jgi:glycosyltransferase involved in cell wall biosynthesis